MIIVFTDTEYDKKTNHYVVITSHGFDLDTGRNVVLPQEHPARLGAAFDPVFGEYVIKVEHRP